MYFLLFRQAIAYIELRLYQFLALTGLHIINLISPSPHLLTLPTRPTRPLSSHFPHSLLPAPCSLFPAPLFSLLLTNDSTSHGL
ncbi:MAG: hypothetical protein F6J94_07945 [Moorea sp. SIO1F2]|uniref:hypothetical protein n=1 Tax=Moorena sp. SIO1F2 TaxID=2607819 RepID=UPI0013BE3858|nr:hypothetical protein [Moorena sp. SIO1F2]NET81877.1 hypothetical protein [Moorena sp. SIO1F2]